jgi:hypothetical protein
MPSPTRNKVGPADPETRRKKLAEVLAEPTKGTGVAAKQPTMLDAVSAGVEEGTESDTLPNGKKRRAKATVAAKKDLKKRFGMEGKTEDELEL